VFTIEALGAVVGVASAGNFFLTMITSEVFFNLNEVFGHRFDKWGFGDRILEVNNLIKSARESVGILLADKATERVSSPEANCKD